MEWYAWVGLGLVGANVLFVGMLFLIAAIRDWREKRENGRQTHENCGSGSRYY